MRLSNQRDLGDPDLSGSHRGETEAYEACRGYPLAQVPLSSPANSAGRQSSPSTGGLQQARLFSAKHPKGTVKAGLRK